MKFIFFRVEIQLYNFICMNCPPLVELKINNNFSFSQLCPVFTMNVFVCYSILVFCKDRLLPIRIFSLMMVWKLLRKCFRWVYTLRIKKDPGKVWITVNQNLIEMLSLKVVWTTNTLTPFFEFHDVHVHKCGTFFKKGINQHRCNPVLTFVMAVFLLLTAGLLLLWL